MNYLSILFIERFVSARRPPDIYLLNHLAVLVLQPPRQHRGGGRGAAGVQEIRASGRRPGWIRPRAGHHQGNVQRRPQEPRMTKTILKPD